MGKKRTVNHKYAYACIKKSTIFTQSLRNLVKIMYSWVAYFNQVSQWLSKNCGFFNKSIFLPQSGFSVVSMSVGVYLVFEI